jgi:hypothetical protein
MRILTISALVVTCLLAGGCTRVAPWDRDLLAQPKMQLDPYPLDSYLDEHIYYSKESSSGGGGVGGGGCGCN